MKLAQRRGGAVSTDAAGDRGMATHSQRKVKKHLPHADPGSKFVANERTAKANLLEPRRAEEESTKAQPEQELPATRVQKLFIAGLYLYVLSLVWLTLSHYWYGVLPKWLDPD